MKNILLILTGLLGFVVNAQQFASNVEAFTFLDENFTMTTQQKKGTKWIDPIMLQFEFEDAIYVHTYKGKIDQKDYLEHNEAKIKKLAVKANNVESIAWNAVESITLIQVQGEWWLTINGTFNDMEGEARGNGRTFYIGSAAQAEKVKAALEYAIAHIGED